MGFGFCNNVKINKEVIDLLFENGFLDEDNYQVALKKGLANCKLIDINESVFSHLELEIERASDSMEIRSMCRKLSTFLEQRLLNYENDIYGREGWAAKAFVSICVKPVIAGIYEYGDNLFHTRVLLKINYKYETFLQDYVYKFIACESKHDAEKLIKDIKSGFNIFLSDSIANPICDEEGGFYSMTIGYDEIENIIEGAYLGDEGKLNEDCTNTFMSSLECDGGDTLKILDIH